MIRWAVLLALLGCTPNAAKEPPPRTWVYAPSLAAWPLGPITGHIGRSQAPQIAPREGIGGDVTSPLRLPTAWPVGDGTPARAAIYGLADGKPAIELIDIDAGRILWRDTTTCAAPIVGVTADAIVCADAKGTRALGLEGQKKWTSEATFIAITDDRVVTAGAGESVILDAATGDEVARVKLAGLGPRSATRTAKAADRKTRSSAAGSATTGQTTTSPTGAKATTTVDAGTASTGISSDSILASCGDAGRELFAYGQDGELVRIVEGNGGPTIAWRVAFPIVAGLDACTGPTVLVTTVNSGGTSLVALARDTGAVTGTVDGVRGYWPARDGSDRLEVSGQGAVARYARDLGGTPEHVALPVLDELLAKRGQLRLVRATERTAALLDASGVRAYLPLAQRGAVLGDTALVAASWLGSPGETVQRIAFPPRYDRALRVAGARPSVAVTTELRDLPPVTSLDASRAIANAGVGTASVSAVVLDPIDPAVFALALDDAAEGTTTSSIARFDLAAKSWSWTRACGTGTAVGLAVTRALVVCATRDGATATVVALARDGTPRWQWRDGNVDAIDAAGDVVLVHDAARMTVLDASDGSVLGTFESDDGRAMRAAALDLDGMTLVVTAERNRVMARLPRVRMVPAWTLAVAGVVAGISVAGDGALVALEDGDAYRIDGRTGSAVAVPGLDLTWRGEADLVAGEAAGGPIPPAEMPTFSVEVTPAKPRGRKKKAEPRDPDGPPRMPTIWPTPSDLPASWQLTLYELAGGLRARNDYALAQPVTPGRARTAGAPLVVQSGPGSLSVLVIDPERGDPLRRIELSEPSSTTFSTIVDGTPVTGALLANPLRAVLF